LKTLARAFFCAYNRTREIEFDPEKAAANPLNHDGVAFGEAEAVLLDPYALTREDTDSQDEARFVTLGRGKKGKFCSWCGRYAARPHV